MPPEDESEIMTPPRKSHIDVVHSEDIDGPTDFTQNLEYWMTAKLPNVTRPSHMTGQARDDLEEYVVSEDVETRSTTREETEKKDSLMDAETPRKEKGPGQGMSFLSNIPSSLHEEDAQSSTPKTVEHVSSATITRKEFQASVEDHDDTPSRVQSSSAIGATLRSPEFTLKSRPDYFARDSNHDNEDEESETVKSLREALSKLREELDEVRVLSQSEIAKAREEFEARVREQQKEQDMHMQAQEREWQRHLSAARADHEQQLNTALAERNTDESSRAQQELQDALRKLAERDTRISELEETVVMQEQQLDDGQARDNALKEERDAALENHRAMIAAEKESQDAIQQERSEWQAQRKNLENARRRLEAEVESLQAQVANLSLEHANEIDELTSRIEDAANATQRAVLEQQSTARATIDDLEAENNRLHGQLDNKDDEIADLGDQILSLRLASKSVVEEKDKLAARLEHQKSLNDQAAREIQSLRSGNKILQVKLEDAQSADTDALQKLEDQLAEANAARLEADAEVDEAKSELEETKTSLAASQAEALQAREELARYKEDSELVNKAMDKRLRDLMRARELQWAKRLEALRKEMGLRGEVLMREWGKAEMGGSEPQAYRYQFV